MAEYSLEGESAERCRRLKAVVDVLHIAALRAERQVYQELLAIARGKRRTRCGRGPGSTQCGRSVRNLANLVDTVGFQVFEAEVVLDRGRLPEGPIVVGYAPVCNLSWIPRVVDLPDFPAYGSDVCGLMLNPAAVQIYRRLMLEVATAAYALVVGRDEYLRFLQPHLVLWEACSRAGDRRPGCVRGEVQRLLTRNVERLDKLSALIKMLRD